jgi:hypothetical protein
LGFDFNGTEKTMWLEAAKREKLLPILKSWVRTGKQGTVGIPFKEQAERGFARSMMVCTNFYW